MAYNEAGHAVNVANFKELIVFVENLGNEYNPPISELSVEAMKKQATELDEAMQILKDVQANYKKSTNDRRVAYDSLNPLTTRIMATLSFLSVDSKTMQDARTIVNKIKGTSTKKKALPTADGEIPAKTISTSQMSFEQRKENFERLIALLQTEKKYVTNEEELKIASLQIVAKTLSESTNRALEAEQQVNNARQKRDNLLYQEQSGAMPIGLRAKAYIKSKYNTKSAEYKRIQAIKLLNKKM
jgi:exonuclease VII small subunit